MALGDVDLKGETRTYRLNFGVNAMCRLEALDGRPYHDVLAELHGGLPKMGTIRAFVRAALIDPAGQTDEQVGDVIEDIGGAPVILAAFANSDAAIDDVGRRIEALLHADADVTIDPEPVTV